MGTAPYLRTNIYSTFPQSLTRQKREEKRLLSQTTAVIITYTSIKHSWQRMPPIIGISKRPETRLSTQGDPNPTAGKTREELLRAVISTVHNEATAKEYLERKCLVIIGEEYSPSTLSMALLHLSQAPSLSKVLVDGIRAIAIILESMVTNQLIEKVTNAITEHLSSSASHLEITAMDLRQTTKNLRGAAVSITRTADKFTKNATTSLDYLSTVATDVVKAAEELEVANKAQMLSTIISQRVEEAITAAVQEIKAALALVSTSTDRLTATTKSYKDTLEKPPLSLLSKS